MTRKAKRPPRSVPAAQRDLGSLLFDKPKGPHVGEHQVLPLDKIVEPNANARRSYDKAGIEALAQSMRENGLIEPVVVRAVPSGRYELVAGSRRVRAAKMLGWDKVSAIVRRGVTEAGVRAASAVENLQRADLAPYEEAHAYQSLILKGLTQDQVAQACGVGATTVKHRLRLLRLPGDLAARVGEPGFSAEHADILVSLVDQPKALEKAAELVGQPHRWHRRPMLVDEFRDEVMRQLRKSGRLLGDSWSLSELKAGSKKVRDALKAAPKVNLGGQYKDVVVATPEVRKAINEVKAARRQREDRGAPRPQTDWKLERQVDEETDRRLLSLIPKAVHGQVDLGPKGLMLLAAAHVGVHDKDLVEALSRSSGVSTAEVRAIGNAQHTEAGLKKLESVAKRDPAGLTRLLLANALQQVSRYDWRDQGLSRQWLPKSKKEIGAEVRAHLKAQRKAGASVVAAVTGREA